jgi:acyl-CoA thioesterase-1
MRKPVMAAVRLLLVLLVAVAGPLPAQDVPVILAIGESTTAGFGVAAGQSYPDQLQRLLTGAGHHYRVVNHGRSGSTTAMALSGLDRGMALQPAIVLIALGGNDQGNRLAAERTKENLRKMVSMFVRMGATVLLADRNLPSDRAVAGGSSLFAELAAEEGALLMPSLRQDIAGKPELLLADMSHPNAAGYTIVANRIFALLQPHLAKAASVTE